MTMAFQQRFVSLTYQISIEFSPAFDDEKEILPISYSSTNIGS